MFNLIELLGFNEDIFNFQNIFLIVLALIWVSIAVIQDFRKREVANWWNFSLIVFVLAFRGFFAINNGEIWYFLWALIGLVVGFTIANLFYYARVFAGGDAKLIMALGTILPLSLNLRINLLIFILFIITFLISGAIYGLIYSIILGMTKFKQFKREFIVNLKRYNRIIFFNLIGCIVLVLFSLIMQIYFVLMLVFLLFISPYLLIYAKSLENVCLVKQISAKNATVGDWIVKEIKIGNKTIKPYWEGLNEEQVKIIKTKYKNKILIKEGLPFTPAFLFGIILLLYILKF